MELENFLQKCRNDLEKIKTKLRNSLDTKETLYIDLFAYKYTMCKEIYDMFNSNRGGVGYYAKAYGNLENPLEVIFDDMITEYTEPKLLTENKLYRLLDKKGNGNDKTISKDELKAMFNFVYGKDNKEITEESLQNFLKDILDNTIYVTICDDERDLIWRLFVEDEDKNGIIDNFEFVLEKAQEGFDYKKDERVLEYNNRYFIIQW